MNKPTAREAELLDMLEDAARQHCFTDRNPYGRELMRTDSGAISTDAEMLRKLSAAGRFRILRESGRMVVGYWPEHDPAGRAEEKK